MADPIELFGERISFVLGGHRPKAIEPGRIHRFPTNDRRGDVAGWCKLFADLRGGVFGCMRQGISETWTAADRRSMTVAERLALACHIEAATREREQQQRNEWAAHARRNAELWGQCLQLTDGDPVARYLRRRIGIEALHAPACLRLHPALPYWHDGDKLGSYPAMVARLTAPDGRTVALHRTYLCGDGSKADVPTVKKLTAAAGPLAGACIRLHSPQHGMIGVAEGIETALAASFASGVPTVAAYCAGALAGYSWPAGVQSLVIFADADKAGREAADRLRVRALHAGRLRVIVMTPTHDGTDWCDVWAQRGAVAVEGGAA